MKTSSVRELRFSVLTANKVKKLSVTTPAVLLGTSSTLPDGLSCEISANRKPYGSVIDPRMGSDQNGHMCETCYKKVDVSSQFDCPGHPGHISLVRPQIWPLFVSDLTQLLGNICPFCSSRIVKINIRKEKFKTRGEGGHDADEEENLAEDALDIDDDDAQAEWNESEHSEAEDAEDPPEETEDAEVADDYYSSDSMSETSVADLEAEPEAEAEVEGDDDEEGVDSEEDAVESEEDELVEEEEKVQRRTASRFYRCSCFDPQSSVRFKFYARRNPDKTTADCGYHIEVKVTAKRAKSRADVTARFIVPNTTLYQILSRITPSDWRFMYHTQYREYRQPPNSIKTPPPYQPVDLMVKNLFVLPTICRPSMTKTDNNKKQADLITRQYNQIIARNNWLGHHIEQMESSNATGPSARKKKSSASEKQQAAGTAESDEDPYALAQHLGGLFGADRHLTMLLQQFQTIDGVPVGKASTKMNQDLFRGERSLSSAVAALVDKTSRPGVTSKNLAQRLTGKEGLLRANLAGKRVDFSSRTVITPDPDIDVDEVSIPYSCARTLTLPVHVTSFNIDKVREWVRNGDVRLIVHENESGEHRRIWCDEDRMKKETLEMNARENIRVGVIVHRFLMDGDIVIMNRQPTLHKPSMLGHRVRIQKEVQKSGVRYVFGNVVYKRPAVTTVGPKKARVAAMQGFSCAKNKKAFGLSLFVTRYYNADFDGDEMNLHVPQTLEAQAEVRELMSVVQQLGSRFSGIVQDTLMGAYLMSRQDTFLSEEFATWIYMHASGRYPDLPPMPKPAILRPKRMWTGRQLLNLVFCNTPISFHPDADLFGKDQDLVIRQGEILAGQIKKPHFGEGGYVFSTIFINFGPKKSAAVLNYFQAIISPYIVRTAYSVGIKDCVPSEETRAELARIRSSIDERIRMVDTTDELAVVTLLRDIKTEMSKVVTDGAKTNRIREMARAGSKGSDNNVVQITGAMTQQFVQGRRPFGGEMRVFSTDPFDGNEFNLRSRGFVSNSLLDGLTPIEYFCHAAGGREGIIDTGIKTADVGYLTRRMATIGEGQKLNYRGAVDNQSVQKGVLTSHMYGDGMDVSMLLRHHIDIHKIPDLRSMCTWMPDRNLQLKMQAVLKDDREYIRRICIARQDAGDFFWLPVDLSFVFTSLMQSSTTSTTTDARPDFRLIYNWLFVYNPERFIVYRPHKNPVSAEMNRIHTQLFRVSLRNFFCKSFMAGKIPSASTFTGMTRVIEDKFHRSLVQPGEPVGLISTQSLMQSTMQATLNTFHTAGTGAGAAATGGLKYFSTLISAQTPKIATTYIKVKSDRLIKDVMNAVAPEVRVCEIVSRVVELRGSLPSTRIRNLHPIDTVAVEFVTPPEMLFKKRVMPIHVFEAIGKRVGYCFVEMTTAGIRLYVPRNLYTRALVNEMLDVVVLAPRLTPRGKDKNQRGVVAVRITKMEKLNKDLEKEKVSMVEVYGNFRFSDVFRIPGVDPTGTWCNDLNEMQETLGLETTKAFLKKSIFEIVTAAGSNVNPRYVDQIVDYMVWSGKVKPVTRNGMQDFGPLQAAAFEMPVKVLANAALSSRTDPMLSPTSNVIFGQELFGIGTALSEAIPVHIDAASATTTTASATKTEEKRVFDFDDLSNACPILFEKLASSTFTTSKALSSPLPSVVHSTPMEFELESSAVPILF